MAPTRNIRCRTGYKRKPPTEYMLHKAPVDIVKVSTSLVSCTGYATAVTRSVSSALDFGLPPTTPWENPPMVTAEMEAVVAEYIATKSVAERAALDHLMIEVEKE